MDLGIAGRTAAVAAGSAGLGLGAAKALTAEGVRVAICGRDPNRLAAARAELGADVVAISADLAAPDGATRFATDASEALGAPLDIVVTNAGGPPPGTFASTDLDAYQQAFDLNCRGAIAMCRASWEETPARSPWRLRSLPCWCTIRPAGVPRLPGSLP